MKEEMQEEMGFTSSWTVWLSKDQESPWLHWAYEQELKLCQRSTGHS